MMSYPNLSGWWKYSSPMCLTCDKIINESVIINCGLYFWGFFKCDQIVENEKTIWMLNILFWTLTVALKPVTINLKVDQSSYCWVHLWRKSKTLEGKGDGRYTILQVIIYRHTAVSCCLKGKTTSRELIY